MGEGVCCDEMSCNHNISYMRNYISPRSELQFSDVSWLTKINVVMLEGDVRS